MNITMNDRLEFAHDENNPKEWFLHKTADKQGSRCSSTGEEHA